MVWLSSVFSGNRAYEKKSEKTRSFLGLSRCEKNSRVSGGSGLNNQELVSRSEFDAAGIHP